MGELAQENSWNKKRDAFRIADASLSWSDLSVGRGFVGTAGTVTLTRRCVPD